MPTASGSINYARLYQICQIIGHQFETSPYGLGRCAVCMSLTESSLREVEDIINALEKDKCRYEIRDSWIYGY